MNRFAVILTLGLFASILLGMLQGWIRFHPQRVPSRRQGGEPKPRFEVPTDEQRRRAQVVFEEQLGLEPDMAEWLARQSDVDVVAYAAKGSPRRGLTLYQRKDGTTFTREEPAPWEQMLGRRAKEAVYEEIHELGTPGPVARATLSKWVLSLVRHLDSSR